MRLAAASPPGGFTSGWPSRLSRSPIGDAEILDAGADKVLVHQRAAGRGVVSEAQVEMDIWYVLAFREGLIVRDQLFVDRTHALEAAGLSE